MQAFNTLTLHYEFMAKKVVLTDHIYEDTAIETEIIEGADFELVSIDASSAEDVIDGGADATVLLTTNAPITEQVFRELPNLEAVVRMGAGYDNVDVDAATEHGVIVVNVPQYGDEEVASHALALILACDRRIVQYDRHVREGHWDWKYRNEQTRLHGKTLGIVGFGRIGRQLAGMTAGLGIDVIAADPYVSAAEIESHSATKVSFEELVTQSDLISIHTVLNDETYHLFDAETFSMMKESAVLVNVARGGIVDQPALLEALDANEFAVAGLDVTDPEPPSADDPIRTHEDVIVTPHIAWYSEKALEDLRRTPAEEAVRILEETTPENVVNPAVLS